MTDEELCATIDKDSGYIRFTLRKRRNQTDQEEGKESAAPSMPALNGSSVPQQIRDTKRADALCAAAKKTRLLLSYEKPSAEDIGSVLGSRRHSELSSNNISSVKDKFNNISTTIQSQPLSSSQNDINMTASVSDSRPSDLNNNSGIASQLKLSDKQAAFNMKQWFSVNLAGLIEYSQKFIQNGFDNIQFLNHPTLMSDQHLKLIGIQDQSHRILILDRIYKELKEVDFDNLLNSSNIDNQKLTISSLFEALQLSHLVSASDIDKNFDLSTSESVNLFKEKYCSSLPLGYRIRISSAIDFLLNKCLVNINKEQQQPQLSREESPIIKQASVESNSSEVDMDISQASSVTTSSSSSSSKDSVKSIVQMKQQQRVFKGTIKQADALEPHETKSSDSSGAKEEAVKRKVDQEQNNSPMEIQVIEQSKKVDDVTTKTTTVSSQNKIDGDKPIVASMLANKQGRTGSLVSEAARKLEAVAAQKNSGVFPIPVPAARRINNGSQVRAQALSSNKVSRETNRSSLVDKLQTAEVDDKKVQQTTVFRNKVPFVPTKSSNWPPKKQGALPEASLGNDNTITIDKPPCQRFSEDSNCLTNCQDIIKEIDAKQQQEQVVKSRPKPALPAKPAKLAANRYIFENNKS